jgi:hypothetical protein
MKGAPVAFLFHVTFDVFENVADEIAVVHAEEVRKFCGALPAGLE